MALTPVEIRHIRLRKALIGYQAKQTDELLSDVVVSFEDVWRDRADLADKLEQMEAELVRYRELEQLLRTTLISAERASQQMTDQTRRESEAVLGEARAEAREIVREAMAERERLFAEVNRLRAQLAAVLETIAGDVPEQEPEEETCEHARPDSPDEAPPPPPIQYRAPGPPVPPGWGEQASPWPQPPTPRQWVIPDEPDGRAVAGSANGLAQGPV